MSLPHDTIPLDRTSARQAVFDRLRTWIEEGVLPPGEAIRDSEVARALGVSRTPVREALQMLEQRGAVEMLPGRLTRVTSAEPEDVTHVYAPLGALNALAVELAVPLISQDDIAELERCNEALRAAIESGDSLAARQFDRAFHGVFLHRASNRYITAAVEPMLLHIRRLEALYFRDAGPGLESYREHRDLIECVRRGATAAAAEITRRNFQRFTTGQT